MKEEIIHRGWHKVSESMKIGGNTVYPRGGKPLSVEEAAQALEEALDLIRHFGWTSAEQQHKSAKAWMDKYFPNNPKNQ